MILDYPLDRPAPIEIGGRGTLDDLFRWAAIRRPQAIALIDPPNRAGFTDGVPRRLTYAQADRMIYAIAGRLHRLGLRQDAIVGLQLANSVESVLALLAVLRAGLIAMPLPLLWRRAEAAAAMSRVGASALIVSGRIGAHNHFDLAMQIAAETFPIRFVCGFGVKMPDGVIGLDDLYTIDKPDPLPPPDARRAHPPGPGAHLAVITWDLTPDGLVPFARNHRELVAGGFTVLLESRMKRDAVILSTLLLSSFAGLASALLPWLMVGGTLALHHPFDVDAFAAQRETMLCDTVILPGPLAMQFAAAGHFSVRNGLQRVIGVWHAPERLTRTTWPSSNIQMTDVQVFGETGLVAALRGRRGLPAPIPFGSITAPRGIKGAVIVGDLQRTDNGTVALRGPMLPRAAFPPRAERTELPHFEVLPDGQIDTGYACQDGPAMAVSGPPPGIVSVGGYRFPMRDLQAIASEIDADSILLTLPDGLTGSRLAGSAADLRRIQEKLAELGMNPLLVDAFGTARRKVA